MTSDILNQIVVVGGGIAGVSTAAALRDGGYAGDLVLIDQADLPYDRPPLSKEYLIGECGAKQIALQPPEWYQDQRVELVACAAVASLHPRDDAVDVHLRDGRNYTADRIVLATGGRAVVPRIPGLPTVDAAGRMHVLRDIEHAEQLRTALSPGKRLLVVGAGLIGAEAAATARGLGCVVTLVDPMDPPLAVVGREVARWLHAQHERAGIDTRSATVASIANTADAVVAQLDDGTRIEADCVLVGVGMAPNVELAVAAGLDIDRGILVDEAQVSSDPRILAVGDAAQRRGQPPAEHWEAAQNDGKRAAATLLGARAPSSTAPWWWSDRHGTHVEGVGVMREPDDAHTVVTRGILGSPPFSVFTVHGGRVIGAVAVNDSHVVRAARRLIDRGVTVEANRLADTNTDLRQLLRGVT